MQWYWSKHLKRDDFAEYAQLWEANGKFVTWFFLCFLIAAGSAWVIGLMLLKHLPFDSNITLALCCALVAASAFGVAGLFFTIVATASVAYHAQRRVRALEDRIAQLEHRQNNSPPI
jgi:hypothetical protein